MNDETPAMAPITAAELAEDLGMRQDDDVRAYIRDVLGYDFLHYDEIPPGHLRRRAHGVQSARQAHSVGEPVLAGSRGES